MDMARSGEDSSTEPDRWRRRPAGPEARSAGCARSAAGSRRTTSRSRIFTATACARGTSETMMNSPMSNSVGRAAIPRGLADAAAPQGRDKARPYRSWTIVVLTLLFFLGLSLSAHAAPRTSDLWWVPDVASAHGKRIDELMYFIYYLTGGVFVLTQIVYIYFLVKYRARKGIKAIYSHGNNRLEFVWTIIPTL